MPDYPGDPQRGRQKQGGGPLHQHLAHQFFLKLPVQFRGEHRSPISRIRQDGAAGTLVNHGILRPGLALQPGFQQVRLPESHILLPEPQTHPAPTLVFDGRSHSKSLLKEKGSRLPAPFRSFSGLLAIHLSLSIFGGAGQRR